MAKIFGVMGDLLRVVVAGQNFMQTVAPETTSSSDLYNIRLEAGSSPSISLTPFPDNTYSVVNQDQDQELPISASISSEQQVVNDQLLSEQAYPKVANRTICISNIFIKSTDTQALRDDIIIPIGDLSSLCGRDWSWGTLPDGSRQRCIRIDGQSDEIDKTNEFLHLDIDQLAEILSVTDDVRKTDLETACKIFGNSPTQSYKMSFSQGINSVFGIDTISLVNLTSTDLVMGEIPADSMDGANFWVADNRLLDSQNQEPSKVAVTQIQKKLNPFGLEVRVFRNIPLDSSEESTNKPRIGFRVFAMRIPDLEFEQQYLDEKIEIFTEEPYIDEGLLLEKLDDELLEDELAEEEISLEEIYDDELFGEDEYYPDEEIFEQELLAEEPLTEQAIILEEEQLAQQELAAERELLKEETIAEEELFVEEILAEEALLEEERFLTDEQKQIEEELLAEKEMCAEEELAEKEMIAEEQLVADERLAEQDLLARKPLSDEMFALEMLEKKRALLARQESSEVASLVEEEEQMEEDELSVEDDTIKVLQDADAAIKEAENLANEALFERQPMEQVFYLETLPVDESRSLDEMLMKETLTNEPVLQNVAEQLSVDRFLSEDDQPTQEELFFAEPCSEHMPVEENFADELFITEELFPEEMFTQDMPADEEIFDSAPFPMRLDEEMLAEMLQGFMAEESFSVEPLIQEAEMSDTELNSELRK
ncbi:hypothetical protein K3495_g10791 [Podosphaera aphanis]|nr:hypothetical protein K3495_g10791 [Podosphaera aphanis]